jgi:hypothetical protein
LDQQGGKEKSKEGRISKEGNLRTHSPHTCPHQPDTLEAGSSS